MDIHELEKSTLSAPNDSSPDAIGTDMDSEYQKSTKFGDIFGGIYPSSQERVFQQPDPSHSDMLHPTITKHVQRRVREYPCYFCHEKFIRSYDLRFHLRSTHPVVCTVCGRAFAFERDRKRHEELHIRERKYVCGGKLSAQPHIAWGCGGLFSRAGTLARHFFYLGRTWIMPLFDKKEENAGKLTLPVLLTRYPVRKDLVLAHTSAVPYASTGESNGLSSNDSGYETALHLDPSANLSVSPVQAQAQTTERPHKALPYHGSLSSVKSQTVPSPPLQNLQDPTDILTLLSDRPETSEDSNNSLVKTISSGDEPACEDLSPGIGLSGRQVDSQGASDFERWPGYKMRYVSNETTLAQEKAYETYSNGHLSDNSNGSFSRDESSSNSGSENGYNETNERSVLDCSQRALVSRLMDEVCSSFFYQVIHRPRQCGQGRQGSRESSASSTQQTMTINSFMGESLGSRRKRSDKEDEDPEDEDDGKHKRSRNQNPDDGHSTRVRYFACPFHKFDASTYGSGNADPRVGLKYRSCGPPGWPNIGKLKEHLYRNHQTPIHCPRCWTIMKTEAALGEHARARNQCDVLPPPLRWIPREVCEKLKNRKKAFAGQTEEDAWRYIFGLLFPDCANIPSPYYNDVDTLERLSQRNSPTSNAIAAYEEYSRAHLPRLVEETLETAVAEHTQPIEEGLRRALAGMVRDCQTRLAQDFLRHRSSNMSSVGGTEVQAEELPSFYIEPLSLAEDIISSNPTEISTNGQDRLQTHSDSGYASGDAPLSRNSSGLCADLPLESSMGSLHDSTGHGININDGSDFIPESSDWAALMENDQDNSFFRNGLSEEFM